MGLLNEFVKNLKIMFRNWTSLSLLIIAPLVFILLVGYAFSSNQVSGISIGVVTDRGVDISFFEGNVSNYAEITRFGSIEDCVDRMALEKIHICIELKGPLLSGGSGGVLPSGSVLYSYDNTRQEISLSLISGIQEFFGLKAEQISIESAQAIITDIQNLVGFIRERKGDITQIKNESESIKADLIERKRKLEGVREDFLPPYYRMKGLQSRLHNYSDSLNNISESLLEVISLARQEISILRLNISSQVEAIGNITGEIMEGSGLLNRTAALMLMLDSLDSTLSGIGGTASAAAGEVNSAVETVDEIIGTADDIRVLLDEEIMRSDDYIVKIDASIERIDDVSAELDTKLEQLSELHPEFAERLVRPIVSEYQILLPGAGNIQISFPQLLVIIIMFIGLLFSNIATLTEINGRAYLRNLIAPVDDVIYFAGLFLTSIVIVFFQILVLFAVAQAKLGVEVYSVFWQMSLVSILLISVFILTGMIFAYIFGSVQSSILVTTFSALLFFLFGNTISPMEAMPGFARLISRYNPLVIGQYLVKEIQLFRLPLGIISPKIILLLVYIGALCVLAIMLFKANNRRRV